MGMGKRLGTDKRTRTRIPKNYGKLEIKKDCQMYSNKKNSCDGECTALNALYCKYRICQFYKKEKVEQNRLK